MKSTCVLRSAAQALRIKCEEEVSSSLLTTYKPPRWASKLRNLPEKYIDLAHKKATPIEEWNQSDVPRDFKLNVKREDLNNADLLSGNNEIRKLEFIFADAVMKKSSCVVTCGSLQSNHCRATAVAANKLGLGCHLLLRSHKEEDPKISANMLLCRMHGAKSYPVPYETLNGGLDTRLHKLADELVKKGEKPYVIPLGGSGYLGTFGIINSFNELMNQGVLSNYDDIVVATGSGGTLAGLAVANYLTGENLRIHGVCRTGNYKYYYQHVKDTLLEYGLSRGKASQVCDVIDGTQREVNTESDLDTSGILLSYSNTRRAVNGVVREMKENPKRFKGKRILYIHTGSIFDGLVVGGET